MKITFKQILMSVEAFKELQEFSFPPKIALDIYKLGKDLDKEMKAYYDLRNVLYLKYKATPAANGGFDVSTVPSEDFEKLSNEMDELVNVEVEIKDYHIPLETFEKYKLSVTAKMLLALDWLLIREEETKEERPKLSKKAK